MPKPYRSLKGALIVPFGTPGTLGRDFGRSGQPEDNLGDGRGSGDSSSRSCGLRLVLTVLKAPCGSFRKLGDRILGSS